ncbi:MAG: CHAT domain-containing protein, partial [Fimbriimonadales bacterium]
ALALSERLAPNSLQVAGTLHNLAQLALTQNQPQTALQHSQRAVAIVETQRQNIQDTETRALFAERYFGPYPLLALAYLQLNQPAQAAEALERSRARSLAETLQQRQLAFADNVPKPLRQLLQQQQRLNAKRQQVYQQLQQAEDNAVEQRAQLQRALLELDQQQRALDDRLRKEFPDYARLILPEPLTVQQIQQSLDAGTVLLYHALAENHLLIVAVSRTQVQGVARKVDGEQLARLAQSLRTALSKPLVSRDAAERRAWQAWGQQLYAQLVAPVQGLLKNAQRVLLCPDGVLSQLPWAALIVKTENGKPVYWVERVALHLTPSVGVYRQARAVEPAPQGVAIAAVWRYTNGKPIDLAQARRSEVATLLRRSGAGTVLTDLPSVQGEVQALRRLFGEGARVAVNAQATPQRARQLAASARVVHFACHARADNTDPLGSALLLAPAGSDVGMLKAGEVLLSWRLRADLVMLSACATGVGAARRYEGVYSLGRAFLVAGSRSVGMSLWEVSDEATVALMKGFYRRYVQGVAKDEALRGAQLELLRNPKYADPYFWSAFVLMGDYRQASQAGRRAAGGV